MSEKVRSFSIIQKIGQQVVAAVWVEVLQNNKEINALGSVAPIQECYLFYYFTVNSNCSVMNLIMFTI